jgi:hypothetical protein
VGNDSNYTDERMAGISTTMTCPRSVRDRVIARRYATKIKNSLRYSVDENNVVTIHADDTETEILAAITESHQ